MNKILILDDSVDLLATMKYVLERRNYEVKTLTDANTINDVIRSFRPDLLILDIYIASQDGREICRQLKKCPENKDLHILLFSASPRLLENYRNCNADDAMEKPFAIKELLEKITSVFGSSLAFTKY
jgi:DNA-binding response OmpR family regulator